ncbi:MAG: hypothetical protein ABIH66_10905 [bacterium]
MELLRRKYEKMLWDPNFEIFSRAGLDEIIENSMDEYRTVAFIDFDDVHQLNQKYGYDDVNRRIRSTLRRLAKSPEVFVARWYSGDEMVVLSGHDEWMTASLVEEASKTGECNGVPFTHQTGGWDGKTPFKHVVDDLSNRVLSLKKQIKSRQIGCRTLCAE